MGPAVTSEADSSAQEKRLRTTASLSPHNTRLEPPMSATMANMNPEETDFVLGFGCHSVSHPSSQTHESLTDETVTPAGHICSGLNLSVIDSGILTSTSSPLNLKNVNIVSLKNIQNRRKVNIFIKNNTRTMLPNGGMGSLATSSDSRGATHSAVFCDGSVSSRTVKPHFAQMRLLNTSQSEAGLAPVNKVHHMIIIPKSSGIGDTTAAPQSVPETKLDSNQHSGNMIAEDKSSDITNKVKPIDKALLTTMDRTISRHKRLHAESSRLLKRLRRLQCREVNSAVKEKLGQVVTSLGQVLGHGDKPVMTCSSKSVSRDALVHRDIKTLSTAELVNLVQKMQLSKHQGLMLQPLGQAADLVENTVKLDQEILWDLRHKSGSLKSNLRHLKPAVDSDATGSSSGGESCDELVNDSTSHHRLELEWAKARASIISRWTWLQAQVSDLEFRIRQQNDICKQLRLAKGSISLHDVISPIIGNSESTRELGCQTRNEQSSEDLDSHKNMSAIGMCPPTRLGFEQPDGMRPDGDNSENRVYPSSASLQTLCSSLVEPLFESSANSMDNSVSFSEKSCRDELLTTYLAPVLPSLLDQSCRAARCMEVRGWRRRTLMRTAGLHEVSPKVAQLSTIGCTCYPPVTPCALCGGRYNKVMNPGPFHSAHERIALLDPSYHSVLSFAKDVPLSLRLAEGQWRVPCKSDFEGRHQHDHQVKSYSRPVNIRLRNKINIMSQSNDQTEEPDVTIEASAKNMKIIGRPLQPMSVCGRRSNLHAMDNIRRKKHLSLARKHLSKSGLRASSLKGNRTQLMRRGYSSCTSAMKEGSIRRKFFRSTFDINNVVIPSHVTSMTRVDILQYKEIITPKWREVNKYMETDSPPAQGKRQKLSPDDNSRCKRVRRSIDGTESTAQYNSFTEFEGDETDLEEETENLSDEAYAARHLRYEIYEKKQCLPTVGQQRRSRSNRSESDSFTLVNPQSPDIAGALLEVSTSFTSSTLSAGPSLSCLGYSDVEDSLHHHSDGLLRSETKFSRNCSWNSTLEQPTNLDSGTPDSQTVPAWPPRSFPLGDSENEQLSLKHPSRSVEQTNAKLSRSGSPTMSTSSDSSIPVDEDPNDPEWTVTSRHKDKPGFLIKFAKV